MRCAAERVRGRRGRGRLVALAACAWLGLCAGSAVAADDRAIVFLLGSDSDATGYFAAAEIYYRQSGAEVVRSARSLAQVREILAQRVPAGPHSEVVLIAHGTEWTGLAVPVFAGGAAANLAELRRAAQSGEFPPLPNGILDAQSRIVIESCGLGRRPQYLAALVSLFVPAAAAQPKVSAASGMVWFDARAWPDGTPHAQRRELAYSAQIVRGKLAATQTQPIVLRLQAQLRPLLDSGQHIAEVILPVRVHAQGDAGELIRFRRPGDYVARLPEAKLTLERMSLDSAALNWRLAGRRDQTVTLIGDGTLVLAMEKAERDDGASAQDWMHSAFAGAVPAAQ